MICPTCGADAGDNEICVSCGTRLKGSSSFNLAGGNDNVGTGESKFGSPKPAAQTSEPGNPYSFASGESSAPSAGNTSGTFAPGTGVERSISDSFDSTPTYTSNAPYKKPANNNMVVWAIVGVIVAVILMFKFGVIVPNKDGYKDVIKVFVESVEEGDYNKLEKVVDTKSMPSSDRAYLKLYYNELQALYAQGIKLNIDYRILSAKKMSSSEIKEAFSDSSASYRAKITYAVRVKVSMDQVATYGGQKQTQHNEAYIVCYKKGMKWYLLGIPDNM